MLPPTHQAVQWQDSDSSSSKTVKECFPNCEVMICGGHAGKNHLKALQKYAKLKLPSKDFIKRNEGTFPLIGKVHCHCSNHHKVGCGCLSDAFIQKARNNFSYILKQSQSAEEFAKRLRCLPRHARDEHEWVNKEGTKEHCDFHPLKLCTCRKCKDVSNFQCSGKNYATRFKLACPFHSLMYEIECNYRASMANSLIHPVFKRGHSNWLEASHNVLIGFRSKDVSLERLHYEVSTNLGMLQSNMTYMWKKRGEDYHWIPELYKKLRQLPLYDGMHETFTKLNKKRKRGLDRAKQNDVKRRRICLLNLRSKESLKRREWSKTHGGDTYDKTGTGFAQDVSDGLAKKKQQCKCGSNTHSRPNNKNCPLNKSKALDNCDAKIKEKTDLRIEYSSSEEDVIFDNQCDIFFEDEEFYSSDLEQCICGAEGRSHKRHCPLNPHALF